MAVERLAYENLSAQRLKTLETAFAPYHDSVMQFAGEHGLVVEKYYRDFPAWFIGRDQSIDDLDTIWWNIQFGYEARRRHFGVVAVAWMDRKYTVAQGTVNERRLAEEGLAIATWPRGTDMNIIEVLNKAHQRVTSFTEQDLTSVSASITGYDGVTRTYEPQK